MVSTVTVVAALGGMAMAFELGGRLGYTFGSATSSSWETVSNGIDSYNVLVQLPVSAPAELRESLERRIDYALINYLSLVDREPSRFDLYPLPLDPCRKLPALAAHRSANRSPSEDPYHLELIDKAVRRLMATDMVAEKRPACGTPSAA